jgi:hypothetical protein
MRSKLYILAAVGTLVLGLAGMFSLAEVTSAQDAPTRSEEPVGTRTSASVNPNASAFEVAQAMSAQPGLVTGANFVTVPVANTTAGVITTGYPGFPINGGSYAILSTGRADMSSISTNLGGGNVRGNTDFDVTILQIDLAVPEGNNCLSFDFRFLSREWPVFVDSKYNDAFIAEIGVSTWTTSGSSIIAPNNFAFDPNGNVVSINATGPALMNAANAAGTPFSSYGASAVVRARTPINSGAQVLYLSIFDQGDQILDSVVFLDNLITFSADPSACTLGVVDVPPEAFAGFCDSPLTAGAVVGEVTSDTRIYWAPGKVSPTGSIAAGRRYWVLGVDATGEYYKIWYECGYLWLPVGVMAPAFGDPVWQGAPLPTRVVN